jgi:hypothetical protein
MWQEARSLLLLFQGSFWVHTPNFDVKGLGKMHIIAKPVQDLSMTIPFLGTPISSAGHLHQFWVVSPILQCQLSQGLHQGC